MCCRYETQKHRSRIDSFTREADEIIRGFDTAQRSNRGAQSGGAEARLRLEDVGWSAQDHGAMVAFLEQVA